MKHDSEQLARRLWTIGDVNRLRLLALLPTEPDCKSRRNVSELAEQLGLSQPTVSNHLARLRTMGVIRCRRDCRDVHYWIDQETADAILDDLREALKMKQAISTGLESARID